jgi:hypothetical protein
MSFWMIEHYDHDKGHQWLRIWATGSVCGIERGELTWTLDASAAMHFARKEDALMFALLHPEWCTLAAITSHSYMEKDPA